MELGILWWLAPPVVVTLAAMGWVTWVGEPRPTDREAAARRLERALRREHPGQQAKGPAATRPRDRSTGIAVRPSRGE